MTSNLNQVLTMINSKMNFFMIKECLSSIGFECESMSIPSLRNEVECLIANEQLNEEANSLVIL